MKWIEENVIITKKKSYNKKMQEIKVKSVTGYSKKRSRRGK